MSVDEIRAAFQAAETLPPVSGEAAPDADPDAWRGDLNPAAPDDLLARCAAYPLNDYGNGQRLMAHFGENILFVPRLGWYRWAGRVWRSNEDELDVRRDAQQIAARILDEVAHIALEDWEKDALDLFLATQGELAALETVKDCSDEQAARLAVLRDISSKGAGVRERLNKAKAAHRAHAKNTGNTSKISNVL